MPNAYPIPKATIQTEETIKKSRFLTFIAHTPGRESAQAFAHSVREKYPDARHHCWACIAGSPNDTQQWGFSDDGEPSGTAGKPILARLEGSGVGELCAVVVRYYGGIKLGTGGLVRAYGGGVGAALDAMETVIKVPQSELPINCRYDQLNDVQHVLAQHEGSVVDTVYGEDLNLNLSLPTQTLQAFKEHLYSHFKGQLHLPEDD